MTDEVFIKVPVPTGRTNEDHLTPAERAFVEYLADTPSDRLRAIVAELLRLEEFRLELRELLLPGEDDV